MARPRRRTSARMSSSSSVSDLEHYRRLELVLANTMNLVVVTNRHREIEWVNPAYSRTTGWTLDEVKGKNPRSFLHGPKTDLTTADRLGKLLRGGQPVTDFEILNHKKTGEAYWVSLSIQPVTNRRGEIARYIAIETDITERKRAEFAAARANRRLAEAMRIARLGTLEHELATHRIHCSAEIFELLETAEDDVDCSCAGLMRYVHPDDAADMRARYEHAINSGDVYEIEHRIVAASGTVKWIHVRGELEGWDDGRPAVSRLVVQEVTDRVEAQRVARDRELLDQIARAQSDILSRVSHELRTPLHAVLGFAEIVERLEAANLSARACGHLGHIRESARHLLTMVDDILELGRLQSGGIVFDIRPLRIGPIVGEVVGMLEPVAAQNGVTLKSDVTDPSLCAHADWNRLRQILINLVGNAIKYNKPHGEVTVQAKPIGLDRLAIAVIDTGIGIPADGLERLFEPFYRVSQAERQNVKSSGLGLAIARNLAQGMGGDIEVESEIGAGSTFVVTLRRAAQSDHTPTSVATADAVEEAPDAGTRGTVLYIEDSEVNCVLIEGYLAARPAVRLLCCPTARQGIALARLTRPSVILIDMHLPDMSGHEVASLIQSDPDLCRIPCIAFSADRREDAADEAIRNGFREYLEKPITAEDFLSALDRLLADGTGNTRF